MKVLAITGDKMFKFGNPRFDLQASATECLEALYWGPGALWASPQGDSFDVVSSQDPFWRGLVGLFWAWRFKARFNVQVHADLAAQGFFKHVLAQIVLKHADSVRVVSEKIKQQVEGFGVHAPISALPVFVDIERFRKAERAPEGNTILWVGRFEDEKDPLHALRVFREVREKVPDVKLIMLGSGSLESELKKAAQGLPVEFPGWHDPLPYLEKASVVLSTSRAESWGVSIVEALAADVPVVAPDVGIAKEAGATVVPRNLLVNAVIDTLVARPHAVFSLSMPSESEWVTVWRRSL